MTGLRVGGRLPSERDPAEAAMRRDVKMVADIGLLRWSAAQQDSDGSGST